MPFRCNRAFDDSGYYAAVGDSNWDNGAACRKKFVVKCIAGAGNPCKAGRPQIEVPVVNYIPGGTTFYLNAPAMKKIQNGVGQISVEFKEA